MKKFSNSLKPIEVEVQNLKGEYKVLRVRPLSVSDMQKMHDMETTKDNKIFDRMCEVCALLFGGKKEDYNNYDVRIIKDVILHVSKELANPIQKVQN